jgi:hypothetical protein
MFGKPLEEGDAVIFMTQSTPPTMFEGEIVELVPPGLMATANGAGSEGRVVLKITQLVPCTKETMNSQQLRLGDTIKTIHKDAEKVLKPFLAHA